MSRNLNCDVWRRKREEIPLIIPPPSDNNQIQAHSWIYHPVNSCYNQHVFTCHVYTITAMYMVRQWMVITVNSDHTFVLACYVTPTLSPLRTMCPITGTGWLCGIQQQWILSLPPWRILPMWKEGFKTCLYKETEFNKCNLHTSKKSKLNSNWYQECVIVILKLLCIPIIETVSKTTTPRSETFTWDWRLLTLI